MGAGAAGAGVGSGWADATGVGAGAVGAGVGSGWADAGGVGAGAVGAGVGSGLADATGVGAGATGVGAGSGWEEAGCVGAGAVGVGAGSADATGVAGSCAGARRFNSAWINSSSAVSRPINSSILTIFLASDGTLDGGLRLSAFSVSSLVFKPRCLSKRHCLLSCWACSCSVVIFSKRSTVRAVWLSADNPGDDRNDADTNDDDDVQDVAVDDDDDDDDDDDRAGADDDDDDLPADDDVRAGGDDDDDDDDDDDVRDVAVDDDPDTSCSVFMTLSSLALRFARRCLARVSASSWVVMAAVSLTTSSSCAARMLRTR